MLKRFVGSLLFLSIQFNMISAKSQSFDISTYQSFDYSRLMEVRRTVSEFFNMGFSIYVVNEGSATVIFPNSVIIPRHIVDNLDINCLRFVVAHEVAHLKFHNGLKPNKNLELDADMLATLYMKRNSFSIVTLINLFKGGRDEFFETHYSPNIRIFNIRRIYYGDR